MLPLDAEDYRALVERASALIWRARSDGSRDYFNAAWLASTGRSPDQELGDGWVEGIHPDDATAYLAAYREHVSLRRPFELRYRLRGADGAYLNLLERGAPCPDAKGASGGFVGTTIVFDARPEREEEDGFDDFFEMSLDHVCVTGFDGYFVRLNPSWTRTLGWTRDELRARPSEDFLHPEDRGLTLSGRKRLHTGAPLGPLVNRYRCKDGTYRWFEWRSVAHPRRPVVYATARDITDQRVAEERLREAQRIQGKLERQLVFADRMASLGTLAAGVAHEINNPLAYVTLNLTLLLEELEDGAAPGGLSEMTAMAHDAAEGAARIQKIVRSLKTFSRAEVERRQIVEVAPLMERAVDMAQNEIRHRARLVKDYGETPPVVADDAHLGQVFVNLLVNAAHAIPEGEVGENEIRIVTSTDQEGRAVIEVRDTGVGIPVGIVGRIFDPFFTTKPVGVGTGLGLSICHGIVTGLGGVIEVVSEESRGTSFRVVLPAAVPAEPSDVAAVRVPVHCDEGGARAAILVVDDEPAIGVALRRVLHGHEVTAVSTAAQALELLASGKRFDVVFSDLMMPEMSGMELYDELARRHPDVAERVVFVSGGAFTPAAGEFLARVVNERIDKPFDAVEIRSIVERLKDPARARPTAGSAALSRA